MGCFFSLSINIVGFEQKPKHSLSPPVLESKGSTYQKNLSHGIVIFYIVNAM